MKPATLAVTLCLALGAPGAGLAQTVTMFGGTLDVGPAGTSNATLTVTGPNGYYAQSFAPDGKLGLKLDASARLADGIYNYEITAATKQTMAVAKGLDNGRGAGERAVQNVGATVSGTFVVRNGVIVVPAVSSSSGRDTDG